MGGGGASARAKRRGEYILVGGHVLRCILWYQRWFYDGWYQRRYQPERERRGKMDARDTGMARRGRRDDGKGARNVGSGNREDVRHPYYVPSNEQCKVRAEQCCWALT